MPSTHINELYMGDLYCVAHSPEEFADLAKKGWSPEKSDTDKIYRSVNDTPEAHKKAAMQAHAKIILDIQRLNEVVDSAEKTVAVADEDPGEAVKRLSARLTAQRKLEALKPRLAEIEAAKARIFGADAPDSSVAKDKSPRKAA